LRGKQQQHQSAPGHADDEPQSGQLDSGPWHQKQKRRLTKPLDKPREAFLFVLLLLAESNVIRPPLN
jgi:hypothetical protein